LAEKVSLNGFYCRVMVINSYLKSFIHSNKNHCVLPERCVSIRAARGVRQVKLIKSEDFVMDEGKVK
jgi:hypothetical protein